MYLIFDTETSGFVSNKLDLNDNAQCRLMQLAWVQLDNKFNEIACFNSPILIPDSCFVNDGAMAAHGLTKEFVNKYGVSATNALVVLGSKVMQSTHVVCHNTAFDLSVLDLETQRNRTSIPVMNKDFCTMKALTPICKIPHKNSRRFGGEFKWPTLQEAHIHCFGIPFEGAHDALADVRATSRLFKWLCERGHVPGVNSKPGALGPEGTASLPVYPQSSSSPSPELSSAVNTPKEYVSSEKGLDVLKPVTASPLPNSTIC